MESLYISKTIEYFTLALIVLGALNWGIVGVAKFNPVQWIADHSFSAFAPLLYILIGISALIHIFSRDYYLPFLGDAAFPCGSLVEKMPMNADASAIVQVSPHASVVYWAAEPNATVVENPWLAYNKFANTGVAKADENGHAVLKFRTPAAYKVPRLISNELKPHVHYRVCKSSGMLGRVETVYM